ncbi:MAG: ABC transporter permease [Desertimonas sp.]
MLRTVLAKIAYLVPVLLLVSAASFFMLELVPGDPAASILGELSSPEQYAEVRARLGLDDPLWRRYYDWLANVVQGDLGESVVPPIREVTDIIAARFPVTLQLTVMSLVMALAMSIPLGLIGGYKVGSRGDRVASALLYLTIALPSFLIGLILVYGFVIHPAYLAGAFLVGGLVLGVWVVVNAIRNRAEFSTALARRRSILTAAGAGAVVIALTLWLFVGWPDFPRQGFVRWTSEDGRVENLRSSFLPALALALGEVAVFARLLRGDVAATLREDYILSARARGLPPMNILVRQALRPSSFSLITVAGVSLGRIVGGTVIVEAIFGLPGMGTALVDAINQKDYPIVQALVLVIATFYVLINTTVDILYSYLDPRIRRA